jgi:glutamate:Na+ symporter, ESS family
MTIQWTMLIHLGIISSALILATWIRARVNFFQKYLIPNPLIAGFILLPLYNFVFPLFGINPANLGEMAYHLLSLSFLALGLKTPLKSKSGKGGPFRTSMSVLFQYGVQGFIGLILTFFLIKTVMPDLFHSFGYLLPLGFGLGPGQAYSIGESWNVFGVSGAGNIGLTFAAIGFIICSFGGVFLINYGIKNEWIEKEKIEFLINKDIRPGIHPKNSKLPIGSYQTTDTEAIDTMTLNFGMVLLGYFMTFLLLTGMEYLLSFAGSAGEQLSATLWGLSFVFAALVGMSMKQILKKTNAQHIMDNLTLNRITGLSVDLMFASAIGAISLVMVAEYWLPIFTVALFGAFIVSITSLWFTSRIFTDHRFLRSIMIFGATTGTLSTGLALLRVVDPDFETPVATDFSYSSAITFAFAIPYILTMNMPLRTFMTGDYKWFWISIGINLAYIILTGTFFLKITGKKAFKHKSKIWYPEDNS